jgi:putative polyketide hydroxylase
VRRGGAAVSALDLVGRDPLLVVGPGSGPWADAVARSPVPVDVLRLGVDVDDPHGEYAKAHGIGPDGALLIRPDGFVAWRSRGGQDPAGAASAVGAAVTRMLART